MGQVTIYLDEKVSKKMKMAAKKAKRSQSHWLAGLIHKELAFQWPEDIVQLSGAWADFPSLREIRSGEGKDMPRETF